MTSSRCRSCGSPVFWAITSSGKRIPVDLVPADDGNLLIVDARGRTLPAAAARVAAETGSARIMVARRGHRSIDPDLPHWKAHFATCVDADKHRRPVVRRTENVPIQEELL